LLAELARDGRTGVVALAKATGWPQSRVSARLEELLSAGALHIAVDLGPAQFGFHAIAYLWLTNEFDTWSYGRRRRNWLLVARSTCLPADGDLPRPSTTS
jgi:DNA-binding Lrp family transcriptional regulator